MRQQAAKIGAHDVIIPSIEGRARITGYNTVALDDLVPLARGSEVTDRA
ncbi:proline racemase family protein [Bosea sp. LC85]|nr:proline racemase family protein [Bosea sp. LC85]